MRGKADQLWDAPDSTSHHSINAQHPLISWEQPASRFSFLNRLCLFRLSDPGRFLRSNDIHCLGLTARIFIVNIAIPYARKSNLSVIPNTR